MREKKPLKYNFRLHLSYLKRKKRAHGKNSHENIYKKRQRNATTKKENVLKQDARSGQYRDFFRTYEEI